MAKYIAYKESGNLINDAVTRCINEGVCTGVTSPGTIYTTPVVGNSASIDFEGSYLGILNVTNNAQKTGMLILGVSSFSGGGQSFQYPLSTLNDAIYSDKVDRTVLVSTTVNNCRSFYFKFPSTVTVNSNYSLYYIVSSTGTSIDVKYYGIIGNPSNSLLISTTPLLTSDEVILAPHIKTDATYSGVNINGSSGLTFSCFYFTIEKDCRFNLEYTPYTFTVKQSGILSLIDGGTLNLSAQLSSKGFILMEGDASISLNGGVLSANSTYFSPSASLLTSNSANTASFKVTNANDIKDWSTDDTLILIPQKTESDYRPLYKVSNKNNDILTINTATSAYSLSNRLKDINYDIINLDSNLLISSTNQNEIEETIYNNETSKYKSDIPRKINSYGKSNLNFNNITIKNIGYLTTNRNISEKISWLNNIVTHYGGAIDFGNFIRNTTQTHNAIKLGGHFTSMANIKTSRTASMWVFFTSYTDTSQSGIRDNQFFNFGVTSNGYAFLIQDWYVSAGAASCDGYKQGRFTWYDNTYKIPLNAWVEVKLDYVYLYTSYTSPPYNGTHVTQAHLTVNGVYLGFKWLATYVACSISTRLGAPKPSSTDTVDVYAQPNVYLSRVTYGVGSGLYYSTDYSRVDKSIININDSSKQNININSCKLISTGNIYTSLITNDNKNVNNLSIKNSIFLNCKTSFTKDINKSTSLSSINFEKNLFLNSNISLKDVNDKQISFKNNDFILLKSYPKCFVDGIQIAISNSEQQEGLFETSKIYSCVDNTAIKYYYINKTNNTISLSNIKIYNDVPTSNSNAMLVTKTPGITYTYPVNITMKDCDITGTVDIYGCNGLVDLKDSIIKQKMVNYTVLYLELSSQNTSINVDNLTCFKGINSASYGLAFANESWTPFSKPQKITVKNSTIYGGIYYSGNAQYGVLTQNCLYNLPQNKDDYSINIFDTKIFNYMDPCRSMWMQDLWPTQVVNISGVQALGGTDRSYYSIYCSQNFTEHAVGGTLLSPYTINVQKCNLNGMIQLEYGLLKYNKFDGSDKNKISGTSFQRILSTNIYNVDCAIEIFNPINPKIHTFIDSLSYTPVNINASDTIKTTFNYPPNPKNTLHPFKLTLKNSILTAGRLNIDNFYGDITNNIVSLSTFDKNITVGDGPVTIKNNKALVGLLSTDEFIIGDNRVNYSYNLNSNGSYSKVEVKSVSSYRLDSINPTTTDIYDNSNFINNRFGFTLASASTGLRYDIKTINSGVISLISPAAATSFSTFSLNTKFNFLRFKSVSNTAVRAKMFLNEKMIYCGSLISYPNFVINMREFEWDKKDTFHIVMYAPAGYGVTLSNFEYSDNGVEFQPISISDMGFYNKLSHDLITKFKTIHPRKNNRGDYTQLFVDETVESPEYDYYYMPPVIVNQNVIKTGSNINLTKTDSKYIVDSSNNIRDIINPKSLQYFYNGDMTLLNDGKYISAEFDGNLVDTGAPSERVVPRTYLNGGVNHPYRTKSSSKYVALSAGEYAKVFVFVSKSEGYSINPINAPRLVLAKNVALGIEEDTILDKFNNDIMIDKKYVDWILLQGRTPAVTKNGVLEFYVDCSGDNMSGTGFINVDSWSASTDNNIGEYWFSDNGETDWNTV